MKFLGSLQQFVKFLTNYAPKNMEFLPRNSEGFIPITIDGNIVAHTSEYVITQYVISR